MKHIVNIVLNDFTNDSRVKKTADSMHSFGNQVSVVALHNKGLQEKETINEVNIHRIRLKSRYWIKIKPIQFLKYLEFIARVTYHYRKAKIIHCNDLNTLPIGLLIKAFGKKVKVVYDCHEYETETHHSKGIEKILKKQLERSLINYADQIITVSDSIANEYKRIYNIPKPNLILNCPPYLKQIKKNIFREKFKIKPDQKIFLYQGGFSKGRGIEILLDVFSRYNSSELILICMGHGPLESLIQEKILLTRNIFIHPSVNSTELLNYTASADYGILFYENTCLNHQYCSPNKIFEYLMAGLPVLSSNLFEMRRLVQAEGIGIVANDNSSKGLDEAISIILKQDYAILQEKVNSVREKYCWENQEKTLRKVYASL